MIITNVVGKKKMREVQTETLGILSDALVNSFGPMGSNSIISKAVSETKSVTRYSKDGYSILCGIQFQNEIENAVRNDLEDITSHIVKLVGDGTTSAILLSNIIFRRLTALEGIESPYQLIRDLKSAVNDIKEEITENTQEFDAEMAYNISLIATNGNEEVANNIKNIYAKHGNEVFVDVAISNTTDSLLKTYDGMNLETGYSDTAYINDVKKGVASIRNPRIYLFEDPVDTPEMFSLFDSIIAENILKGYNSGNMNEVVPTVILAPMVSRDLSSYMGKLIEFMYSFTEENASSKPPFLLISNIYQQEQLLDISRLCGCKPIKKYINPDQQAIDVEKGLAPNLENVTEFYGQADLIEADVTRTKFVNPAQMHDANGNTSVTFNTLVQFLEAELQKAVENGEDNNVTGTIKRRINSLKSNMVEYLVGGVSMSDRDSVRDLVEDAVKNCRSASQYGAGFGANFEGLRAANILKDKSAMHSIIFDAYTELAFTLYNTCVGVEKSNELIKKSLELGTPYNLRTESFDFNVLCSIKSDDVILDAISQIISLMFTSNQFLCPTTYHNKYLMSK